MTTTYQDMLQFLNTANGWLERNQEPTKLRYAVTKVAKSCGKLWGEYQERCEEIRIDQCAVDEKGVILRDEKGGYRFTKDGLKECNKQINALFKSSVAVESYYASELPAESSLRIDELETFEGFVIREQQADVPGLVNGKSTGVDVVN